MTTDDIVGAQADFVKLPNVVKRRNQYKDTFNPNPIYGGPKYGNSALKRYEQMRVKSRSSLHESSSR